MSESTLANPGKIRLASCLRWAAFLLVLLLIVTFFAGFLPIRPVAVATGSMSPSIQVGDAVMVCRADPEDLKEGDVIQFRRDGSTVVHRIVEIKQTETGELGFITQGDSNNTPDSGLVTRDDLMGKVLFTIPKIGFLSLWVRSLLGQA